MSVIDLEIADTDIPADVSAVNPEFVCQEPGCNVALTYGGRGRKPKYCDDHKRKSGASKAPATGSASAQGKQAAAVLVQLNGLVCMGLMVAPMPFRLPTTASAIAAANDEFERQAALALTSDPALAKLILKGGAASGKMALVIAYGMLAGAVAPVAVLEYKANRESRADGTGS